MQKKENKLDHSFKYGGLKKDNEFSLNNYFKLIGLKGLSISNLSLESLTTIMLHQNNALLHQNRYLFSQGKLPITERNISALDKHSVYKDVKANKGGYCMQLNQLLFYALTEIGFKVDRYMVKSVLQSHTELGEAESAKPNMPDNPKTHEILMVYLDNKKYIVDCGMNRFSLRQPVEFKEGIQNLGEEDFCLTKDDKDRWTLDTKAAEKNNWFRLYHFYDQPCDENEIVRRNKILFTTKRTINIRDNMPLSIGHVTFTKNKSIFWFKDKGLYRSSNPSGKEKVVKFDTLESAQEYAIKKFGIK